MSGPKHTPTVLSGPCPGCEGRGYDYESGDWSMDQPVRVACPDCAGTGKAANSITANEKLRDAAPRLAEALKDALAGLKVARQHFGMNTGHLEDKVRAALREAGE